MGKVSEKQYISIINLIAGIGHKPDIEEMLSSVLDSYREDLACNTVRFVRLLKDERQDLRIHDFYSRPETDVDNFSTSKIWGLVKDKLLSPDYSSMESFEIITPPAYHYVFPLKNTYILILSFTNPLAEELQELICIVNKKLSEACQLCEEDGVKNREIIPFTESADNLNLVFCETDLSGQVVYANKFALKSMEYEEEDLKKGIHISKLFHPEEKERLNNNFNKVLENGFSEQKEYVALKKGGDPVNVLLSASPIIKGNDAIGVRGVLIDITEQRQNEKLKNAEIDLNFSFKNSRNLEEIIEKSISKMLSETGMIAEAVYMRTEKSPKYRLLRHLVFSPDEIILLGGFLNKNNTFCDNEELLILDNFPDSQEGKMESYSLYLIAPIMKSRDTDICMVLASGPECKITDFKKELIKRVIKVTQNAVIQFLNEEKLGRYQQDLETLFNTIEDFLFVMDKNGKIIHTNLQVEYKLGYSQREISGRNIAFLHSKSHNRQFEKNFQEIQEGRETTYTLPLKTRSGSSIPAETKIFPGRWRNSEVFIGISRDITQRERAGQLLKKQRDELKRGLRHQTLVSEIALEINTHDEFNVRINSILEKVGNHTGVSRVYIFEDETHGLSTSNAYEWCNKNIDPQIEELQGVPYEMIPSWKEILDKKGRVYSENISGLPEDIRAILEPQDIKSIVVYPLFVQDKFFGFIGFDECIRNKKWTHSELELLRTISGIISNGYERHIMKQSLINERDRANRANRAKSEFLANMSHEIRTPMNAILGYSEALYHKMINPQDKNMVKYILSSGNLLLSLLNDILDLSKIEAGRIEITPQPVDLANVIHEIEMLFTDKARNKNVRISFTKEQDFPSALQLDEILIKQVLFNLIGNAVKFTHKGSVSIRLSYKPDDESKGLLEIRISDTGIGIPENQREIIFEAFSQQEGQSSRKYEGTGLGLAISQRLVKKMGGDIHLTSKVGEGSVFNVLLPGISVANVSTRRLRYEDDENRNVKFHDKLVLIVDDVASNIITVENMLSTSGLRFISADSGDIALEILNNTRPDLVLLDLRMPGTDGYEVAKRIRQNPDLDGLKIVAYTASVFSSETIEETGHFDGFLFKPVSRSELVGKLMEFLPYYSDKEEVKQDNPLNPEDMKVDAKSLVDLPVIIEILDKEFREKWNEIKETLVLYKIEDFIKQLRELGERYEFEPVLNYSKLLQDDMDILDLNSLKKDILKFSQILEYLKSIK